MKRLLFVLFTFNFSLFISFAQTASTYYQPGVTSEGAVYFLPKTAVNITIQVEKTTYTPGDFCKYSERYLRIKGVSPTPSVNYRITAIREEAVAKPDTTKGFAVKFDAKTSATNVRLSDDGILLAINAEPNKQPKGKPFVAAPRPVNVNPRQYMSEEILAAGSTAKMAELTAQDIYEIRESRNLLIRGQADNMPKDGEQLRLMLNQLDLQDHAMTSLFTGTTVKDTTEYTLTIVPDKDISRQVLFRFSQKLGLVEKDDLAGVPYYITIEDLKTIPAAEPIDPKKKSKQAQGVYVNIPGRLRSTISNSQETIVSSEFPAGQFGNVELLSGALFNKRYTTHLWLNPLSGAVDKLEAEQPK
ncbi:MAG: DUF4831 family protein [Prevotella sp.]|nr:DUF4831 family protein [Prevotella sp.]